MAAFSYQNHHFHPDHSFFFPNPPPTKMQGLILEENTNSIPYFSQFNTPTQEIDRVDNNRGDLIINYNNHEPCLTNKQSIDSSVSMVDHIVESGENATSSMEKKRKNRGASSSYSAQSQDAREEKEKKRRMKYKGIEEENPKIGRKNKKKNQNEEELKGYIHVRARRGQATDSHSLAERVRREKISERMKILQALVPGCDKVTGKALMLDEIINYVQSLQNQVEFLSMKLASVNPMLYDFGMDLDGFMVKPESLSNMASQLPSGQPWGPTNTLSNDHPFLDHFASLVFQQAHMPSTTTISQGNGQALLGGDEQRQKIINQALISNSNSNSNSLCFPLM